jgi:hypothetical protein
MNGFESTNGAVRRQPVVVAAVLGGTIISPTNEVSS